MRLFDGQRFAIREMPDKPQVPDFNFFRFDLED
jgi:hypothetical protein